LPFDVATWLIWLGALVVVFGVAEALTAWRRHRHLSALPGTIMTGRSLWQKRGWALGMFLFMSAFMLVFGHLESWIDDEPIYDSFGTLLFFAFAFPVLMYLLGYVVIPSPRLIAFDEAGGTICDPDSKPVRFEWSELLAAGTLGKSGLWALTEAGNVYWMSTAEGHDAIAARLREEAGDRFYEDRSPLGVLRSDPLSESEPASQVPLTRKVHARLSLRYSGYQYLILAALLMVALLQLSDAIEDGEWLSTTLIFSFFNVAFWGSFIILTLFRRRFLELSPEGWRRCGFTRGKLHEWQYCSRFAKGDLNSLNWKYGPVATAVRPIDFYGYPSEELAGRLNAYREQALAAMRGR
jgi:hypothetical protein